MNDTSPEIERTVRQLMINRSGVERMKMAAEMFDVARTMAMATFPPSLDEIEIKQRLCRRFYCGEVDIDAFSVALRRHQLQRHRTAGISGRD